MSFLLDEEKTWIQRDFGLDRRLIKALSKLGFTYPTLVQSRCIPIALQGKDVLVRARTGSGEEVEVKRASMIFNRDYLQLISTSKRYYNRQNCGLLPSLATQTSHIQNC